MTSIVLQLFLKSTCLQVNWSRSRDPARVRGHTTASKSVSDLWAPEETCQSPAEWAPGGDSAPERNPPDWSPWRRGAWRVPAVWRCPFPGRKNAGRDTTEKDKERLTVKKNNKKRETVRLLAPRNQRKWIWSLQNKTLLMNRWLNFMLTQRQRGTFSVFHHTEKIFSHF